MRNWAKTSLLWNLALDENNGPAQGGCTDCRGVLTVASNGNVFREVEYYIIGHFSRFVRPGARRIGSTTHNGQAETVSFRNPDGSIVLVVLNPSDSQRSFEVRWGEKAFTYRNLPSRSVVTLVWQGD